MARHDQTMQYLREGKEDFYFTIQNSRELFWGRVRLLGKGTFDYVFLSKTIIQTPTNQEPHLPLEMAVKAATMDKSSSLKHEKRILSDLTASPYVVRCYGDEFT